MEQGALESYLIEITAHVLGQMDSNGVPLIDNILDAAKQKGTGKWTSISALELGAPLSLIDEAVFARYLSTRKEERQHAQTAYSLSSVAFSGDLHSAVAHLHDALYASKIIAYAQGFMLLREAAQAYRWTLSYRDIALTWRGGCIIRSRFLNNIGEAFANHPQLRNLLLDDYFVRQVSGAEPGWRQALRLAIELGIPVPAMAAGLSFLIATGEAACPPISFKPSVITSAPTDTSESIAPGARCTTATGPVPVNRHQEKNNGGFSLSLRDFWCHRQPLPD